MLVILQCADGGDDDKNNSVDGDTDRDRCDGDAAGTSETN